MNHFIFLWLIYTVLPAWILMNLWKNRCSNLAKWLPEVATSGLALGYLIFLGLWPLVCGYYARYVIGALFLICLLKSILNVKRTFVFERFKIKSTLSYGSHFVACCFFAWQIGLGVSGSVSPSSAIDLDFPLKNGLFYIAHGGTNESVNHHYRAVEQRYALDITQLNKWGLRSPRWMPRFTDDFFILRGGSGGFARLVCRARSCAALLRSAGPRGAGA